MTTTMQPKGWRGWSVWCVIAISLAVCAPVFAGSDSTVAQPTKMQVAHKAIRKLCYVQLGLGLPLPCDRFAGAEPTTAGPIEIIGRLPAPK